MMFSSRRMHDVDSRLTPTVPKEPKEDQFNYWRKSDFYVVRDMNFYKPWEHRKKQVKGKADRRGQTAMRCNGATLEDLNAYFMWFEINTISFQSIDR